MTKKYTSAGRLLDEAQRLRKAYSKGNQVHQHIAAVFGPESGQWAKGLAAFHRLIQLAREDAAAVADVRLQKYEDAFAKLIEAVGPHRMQQGAVEVAKAYLEPLVFERLEALDEILLHTGRSQAVDEEHARRVEDELKALIAEIEADAQGELDEFLLDKLRELSEILGRFRLYGPEGVEDAVSGIIGGYFLRRAKFGSSIPDSVKTRSKQVFTLLKGVLDAVVYTKAGVDVIEWAGSPIAGLLEG